MSWGPNRIDVFARGQDRSLWHSYWDGRWHLWVESLGRPPSGDLTSAPSATSRGPDRLDVLGRGAGDSLWMISWDGRPGGGGWSAWQPLPADAGTDPAVVAWGNGSLQAFANSRNELNLWTAPFNA